jgi:site-specific recombinase XerD
VHTNTIRGLLGHVSLTATNVYAEVKMNSKALANCEVKEEKPKRHWRNDKRSTEFLTTL